MSYWFELTRDSSRIYLTLYYNIKSFSEKDCAAFLNETSRPCGSCAAFLSEISRPCGSCAAFLNEISRPCGSSVLCTIFFLCILLFLLHFLSFIIKKRMCPAFYNHTCAFSVSITAGQAIIVNKELESNKSM
jgi:hypothetical protein